MDFRDKTVIKDLSFDVRAGETFGFLGSNRSGKTTTLRAPLGIYQPTAGTLHIGGKVFEPRDGARLGCLPEGRSMCKKEAVRDVLVYFGRRKGLSKAHAKTWSQDYLERFSLAEKASARLDKLSGASVIMVTYQIEEVEWLCHRVILLKDGTARAYGTFAEVQEQFGGTVYRLTYDGVLPASALYDVVTDTGGQAELAPRHGTTESVVLRDLVEAGVGVPSFTTARVSLEEIFIQVYANSRWRRSK